MSAEEATPLAEMKVADLAPMQAALQEKFDAAQVARDKANAAYKVAKGDLVDFNNRYGRVIQLMAGDEDSPKPESPAEEG